MKNDEQLELYEGNYIIFKKVKKLEFLNDLKPRKILKTTNSSFEIEKENEFNNKYIYDGIIEEVTIPKKLEFESFKENFIKPNTNFNIIDKTKKIKCFITLCFCRFTFLLLYI